MTTNECCGAADTGGTSCSTVTQPACGCGQEPAALVQAPKRIDASWVDGTVTTALGAVPRIRTELDARDRLGTLRARCGIGRMDYRVPPALYAVGNPTPDSPVLVSANYKLSFDTLRRTLSGLDAWILVIDTHGINVWCAAGKGLFGTAEVVRRVIGSGLTRLVSHRKLVLPQLSATGVSAHEVRKACGFTVVFGPVRAADLPAFLDARMKASPEMRRVHFGLKDRAVLVPVEIVGGGKYALLLAVAFLLLGGLNATGYTLAGLRSTGATGATVLLAAFLAGTALGPILLPWLPGRAFALKGAALGVVLAGLLLAWHAVAGPLFASYLHPAAWMLMVPAMTSFVVMTFTGSSTFTSLSGVLREMRVAVPAQIAAGSIGAVLWVVGLFVGGGLGR